MGGAALAHHMSPVTAHRCRRGVPVALLLLLASSLARASAARIGDPPPELDEIVAALAEGADAVDRGDWALAERDGRIARFAWSMARFRPAIDELPLALTERMDRVAPTLERALDARSRVRAGRAANLGARIALDLVAQFRRRPGRPLLDLRASVREARVAALRGAWSAAALARSRALLAWQRLRDPLDRRAASTRRTRALVPDLDACFDELSAATEARDPGRVRRAARCALDLTDAARPLLRASRPPLPAPP